MSEDGTEPEHPGSVCPCSVSMSVHAQSQELNSRGQRRSACTSTTGEGGRIKKGQAEGPSSQPNLKMSWVAYRHKVIKGESQACDKD